MLFGCSNVAEALISKGLGTVVRYRIDDDQRSSAYDPLLAAEARAQKKGVGVHSKKDASVIRVADVSGVRILAIGRCLRGENTCNRQMSPR